MGEDRDFAAFGVSRQPHTRHTANSQRSHTASSVHPPLNRAGDETSLNRLTNNRFSPSALHQHPPESSAHPAPLRTLLLVSLRIPPSSQHEDIPPTPQVMDTERFAQTSSSPTTSMARRWARRIERCCCSVASAIPLIFVYGLTTWAVWVDITIGSAPTQSSWLGMWTAFCALRPTAD